MRRRGTPARSAAARALCGIRARERMRRIHQGGDALGAQEGGQPVGAAEAADAARDRRRRGGRGAAGQRQHRREPAVVGQQPRERARLAGAAKDQHAQPVAHERSRLTTVGAWIA